MATSTLLITEAQFISTIKSEGVWGTDTFQRELDAFHEGTLQDVLDDCATDLQTRTENDTLTTADNNLLPYVRKWIAAEVYARWILSSATEAHGAGLGQHTSEGWVPATNSERQAAHRGAKAIAETYHNNMITFLQDNQDTYSCYTESHAAALEPRFINELRSTSEWTGTTYPESEEYPFSDRPIS